ncbi:MAG TPA: histidine kinase, partial [Terriglobales bacterium]|nr:histidine kinase [Terriglobales bacterium]
FLVAVWMDPGEIRHSPWALWLLAFYIVHGVVIMLLLRIRQESTPSFRLLVHAADIIWPALISIFTTGQGNPFFLFFVFVLAAAAYRWGLWETVGTALAAVCLLWGESLAFHRGFINWIDGVLLRHDLPLVQVDVSDFEPKRLFMRSAYLLVMALLLGYLAEQQKKLRAEKAVIARILGKARVESGLTGTLQEIVGELLIMYGATYALVASQDTNSQHVYVGEVRSQAEASPVLHWLESSSADPETYLYPCPAETSYVCKGKGDSGVVALDSHGVRLRNIPTAWMDGISKQHQYQCVMTISFIFGREWWGRIFFLDPSLTGDIEEELRFLQELVRQVGPAVYNVYLLRRLRLRAGAVERARFARELHDGAVQSLIAVEMQVDVLRRQSGSQSGSVTDELGRIQGLLREEVLKLRELMQQMKSLDVDSRKLLRFLEDTVERFQRETGISARFVSEMMELNMPQPVCREIARIVQEALVNVRKHSGARQVLVRFSSSDARWNLVIEDNGRGFPFSGRLSQAELEALGKGPLVIKERIRLIDGELTIESNPGRGSRLEIGIPQKREAAYG